MTIITSGILANVTFIGTCAELVANFATLARSCAQLCVKSVQ